jgi:KDO2-lipid IV(A) lauroyltransferase
MNSQSKSAQPFSLLPAGIYFLSLPFIYLVSALPFKLLYLFSDFLNVILFRLIGYRKKIVLKNLRNSFPEKTEQELYNICKKFYRHLCDFFLETIKLLTINKGDLLKRCQFTPDAFDVFSKFADQNKSVLLVMGHNGNREWSCNAFNILSQHQLFVIYHPVSNKYFDGLMHRIRSRSGTRLIAMKNTYREMAVNKNGLNATAFVADQTPRPEHAYWTTFLNQDTPVFKGMEVIAKKMNLPVLYTSVKKISRGYYEMNAEVLSENPLYTMDGELSEMFIRRLEKDIVTQPETWLWSHRRWKYKRTPVFQINRL